MHFSNRPLALTGSVQELRQLPAACAIGVIGAAVYLMGESPQAPVDLLDTRM